MPPSPSTTERWLAYREVNPRARRRLFCFPYAGGGASAYRGWAAELPADVEVCPVQLPGRESRLREPAFQGLQPLVAAAADALQPLVQLPFAFFGHGMGAAIAYGLACELRSRGRAWPEALFVAGRRAPEVPLRSAPLHDLPDAELIAALRERRAVPEEVLAHEELMRLLLPILRADLAVDETASFGDEAKFAFALSAFVGTEDDIVPRADVEPWAQRTVGAFRLRELPGDQFFIHSSRALLLEALARDLAQLAP